MRLKLICSESIFTNAKGDLRMDKKYNDIQIENWKTNKQINYRMITDLSIEFDESCVILSFHEKEIYHVITVPKEHHIIHIG